MLRPFITGLFALALTVGSGFGAIVDFNTLPGNNSDPFATYTENGFTVASTTGSWFGGQIYGNPAPSIFLGPIGSVTPGSITVSDGSQFSFSSVDFSSNNGTSGYSIEGFLGGSLVFTETGTEPDNCASGCGFSTLASSSSATIDTLLISLTPSGTSFNIDNIVLNGAAPVPEPSSAVLLGLMLLGLGPILKRKLLN